jgi:hypothetical protein
MPPRPLYPSLTLVVCVPPPLHLSATLRQWLPISCGLLPDNYNGVPALLSQPPAPSSELQQRQSLVNQAWAGATRG